MIEWTVILQIDRMNHRQLMRFTLYKVYKKKMLFCPIYFVFFEETIWNIFAIYILGSLELKFQ